MEVFVQACDSNYGAQGLALLRSIQEHMPTRPWQMVWVCLDTELYEQLSRMELGGFVHVVRHDVFLDEGGEHEIAGLQKGLESREGGPWFWTWAAQVTAWALNRYGGRTTYLDTDLLLYSDPSAIFAALDKAEADVGVFTHKFPPQYADRVARGVYNVGWVTFEPTDAGLQCAGYWAQRVRDICLVDMPELKETLPNGELFERAAGAAGDQPWLEAFPQMAKVHVLDQDAIGAALAPYNLGAYRIEDIANRTFVTQRIFRGTTPDPEASGKSGEVIFYHAHEEKFDPKGNHLKQTGYPLEEEAKRFILQPYYNAVAAAGAELWPDA